MLVSCPALRAHDHFPNKYQVSPFSLKVSHYLVQVYILIIFPTAMCPKSASEGGHHFLLPMHTPLSFKFCIIYCAWVSARITECPGHTVVGTSGGFFWMQGCFLSSSPVVQSCLLEHFQPLLNAQGKSHSGNSIGLPYQYVHPFILAKYWDPASNLGTENPGSS